MSPGREQGRAERTGLHCGGPRATPSRARSPRSRKRGEEIAGETGRGEDAAPTLCGRERDSLGLGDQERTLLSWGDP